MLRLDSKDFSAKFTYSVWLLMAFQAGYVNVGGLFTSGNFVSHVTGTSSNIGMGLAKLELFFLMTFITILFAFIAGASLSGHYIGRLKEEGKEPRYVFVLGVKSIFFGLVLLLSSLQQWERFGLNQDQVDLLIIFFLSFCCGVQNSTCSQSTDGFLKPTHMTGLSTDIGIFLTKIFAWKDDPTKFQAELRKNLLRVSILIAFIFGGGMATLIFSHNGHYGFLFPFVSSVCFLSMAILRDIKKMRIESLAFRTTQYTVLATFILTILFGINAAYTNLTV